MSHINKNNASFWTFISGAYTYTVYKSTLNHETFKYQNPELAHEYTGNSQMFNKMSRKNTFWNKIKCYVTLHTISVMFNHVFPAVGIQNVKMQKEFWKRFDDLPPSWFCFLAPAWNVYDVM